MGLFNGRKKVSFAYVGEIASSDEYHQIMVKVLTALNSAGVGVSVDGGSVKENAYVFPVSGGGSVVIEDTGMSLEKARITIDSSMDKKSIKAAIDKLENELGSEGHQSMSGTGQYFMW